MTSARVRVLLIVGASRSGSTLLDLVLGSSAGAVSLGEIHNIWRRGFEQNHLCGCGQHFDDCPFWTGARDVLGADHGVPVQSILDLQRRVVRARRVPWIIARCHSSTGASAPQRDYLDWTVDLYRAIVGTSGDRTIVDSSKRAVHGLLLATRPDVDLTVVHLIRDSRAMAFSAARRRPKLDTGVTGEMMARLTPSASAKGWVMGNILSEVLTRLNTKSVRVRYEDFVADPEAIASRILRLAGLPPLEAGLQTENGQFSFPPSHTVSGNPIRMTVGPVLIRPDDEWCTAMPATSRRLVTFLTSPLLVRYCYPLRIRRVPGALQPTRLPPRGKHSSAARDSR